MEQVMKKITEKRLKLYGHVKRSAKKNGRCQEREEAKDQNTLVKEIWKVWVKSGKRIGLDKVEERYSKPFRRPQMMGKA